MSIKNTVQKGLPLHDIFLVDAHCHLGQGKDFHIPYADLRVQFQNFCHTMDRVGVDYACISLLEALFLGDLEANFIMQDFMELDARILAWAVFVPCTPQASIANIQKCRNITKRYIGIKIHPDFHQTKLTDKAYRSVYEYANDEKLPILIHTWQGKYSDPFFLDEIVSKYPNAKFLLAHCGGVEPCIQESIRLASQHANVFLDLNGGFIYSQKRLEDYTSHVDTHKLLFSSDTVFNNICWEIGNIAFSFVPEDEKKRILGLNAKKLFCISTQKD